ncbi:MAG: type II toxin-antitoxin system HicA family toxin [Candidatus Aureabacteria bacterium]|nr:type II toxin-antitoxin system HicA family toxin [Candidatus Auribacterota bacterium]
MKRNEFVRSLTHRGCCLHRHGSRHDIYANPHKGRKAPIPRHPEIKDSLARLIKRQLGID